MFQIQCVIYTLALKKGYCVHKFVFFQSSQLSNKPSVLINCSQLSSVKLSCPFTCVTLSCIFYLQKVVGFFLSFTYFGCASRWVHWRTYILQCCAQLCSTSFLPPLWISAIFSPLSQGKHQVENSLKKKWKQVLYRQQLNVFWQVLFLA